MQSDGTCYDQSNGFGARVRSVALCGTDRAGFAAFKTPPFFGSSFGNRVLTSLPVLSSYTAEWFRSRGAPVYDAALVEVGLSFQWVNAGLEAFRAIYVLSPVQ